MTYLEILTPEDLATRDGKEFLVAHDAKGQSRRLRLDRLATIPVFKPAPPDRIYRHEQEVMHTCLANI